MDLNKVIAGLSQSGVAGGLAGGLAGGALSGALFSKGGRKVAKKALQAGGLVALGGLAWKAYQNYRAAQPQGRAGPAADAQGVGASGPEGVSSAPDSGSWQHLSRGAFELPGGRADEDSPGLLVVRAMITAAMADGHIDAAEKTRIFGRVSELALDADEKALLFDELSRPMQPAEIVRRARHPEAAIEVYAASVLAIDASRPEARSYLDTLAEGLGLPDTLVREIEAQAQVEQRRAAA